MLVTTVGITAVWALAIGSAGLLVLHLFPPLAEAQRTSLGHLGLAAVGLALVEQIFRNTRPEHRWAIKFLCLSAGGLFVYDFFLYADGLLFRAYLL